MNHIEETARRMKLESPVLAACPGEQRNEALSRVRDALIAQKDRIFAANQKDLARAEESGVAPAILGRLKFDDHKLADVTAGIDQIISLPDPVGKISLARELDQGLTLYRESCPIGVIGVIFEARPDAMVQISSLCLKSGNCAILKGGSETRATNQVLFQIIHEAAVSAGLPEDCLAQADSHQEIDDLLTCDRYVDLLIPRGSNAFVRYIMDHTKIPVMGHADGICHIYVDRAADIERAIPVVVDAKVQYTAACNAAETLLVHRDIAPAFLPRLAEAFREEGVTIRGTREVQDLIPCEPADEEDFRTEYLALIISVKLVDSVEEAVRHINLYGSHHTDAIMTEDPNAARTFMSLVDSAGVYQNCSTRFADGFRYGFGAEVGISTGKIHARGPVGLEGLMTYKYKLFGQGQTVGDYASGKRQFHFRDLPEQEG